MTRERRFPLLALLLVLAAALTARALILLSQSISFHSDEAVVGLMARHIVQGARPIFFYGQAYMGSLDAWLIAAGFTLFGESVATIRLVQSALYLVVVALTFTVGWGLTEATTAAVVAGLAMAIPPVMTTLYTTATLGGYNETLILGALIILLGYDLASGRFHAWRWLLLGLCAGLGWWTNALIIVYVLPVAGLLIWQAVRRRLSIRDLAVGVLIALLGFALGAAPWIVFNLENDFAGLAFLLGSTEGTQFAGIGANSLSLIERVIGFAAFGLPTLIGARAPWSPEILVPPAALVAAVIWVLALIRLARTSLLDPSAKRLLWGMIGGFTLIFLASRFSADPTGRYFLPLTLPFSLALGVVAASLSRRWIAVGLVGVILAYQGLTVGLSASRYPGLTTQFNLTEHLPNEEDGALMAFLEDNDLTRGYASYWISFRLAFLSGERLQLSAALPPKADLVWTPFYERYPPYRDAAASAERIAYITANIAEVEAGLSAWFAESDVTYQRTQIGIYTVFHDFAPAESAPRPPVPFAVTASEAQ